MITNKRIIGQQIAEYTNTLFFKFIYRLRQMYCTAAVLFSVIALLPFIYPERSFCQETAKQAEPIVKKMSLADAVYIALTNNVTLRSAYLDRYLQRTDLAIAERQFYLPTDPMLTLAAFRSSNYNTGADRTENVNASGNLVATLAIPTGGKFDFSWNNGADRTDLGQDFTYTSSWGVLFTQPLLKGGGMENAAYSVKIARITEETNILTLRDVIASTIQSAITAYRNFKSAERSLVIADMSLARSKALYDYNKEMIAAGRLAGTEIVQSQADIANQETSVITAKNALEDARLALVQTLYIDKRTLFTAMDESEVMVVLPPAETALSLAFQNRTDYLRVLQDLETKKLTLAKNKRNRLWSLNFVAGTTDGAGAATSASMDSAFRRSVNSGGERNWGAGLSLDIPLIDMTSDMRVYLGAKNDVEKANLAMEKLKLDIEINVQSAIRNVDASYRQYMSSKSARELSERKLSIEQEKLSSGRTTNFQLVSFQRDLQTAQSNELSAMTAYLNSLTNLDAALGTTLQTWKIEVKKTDDKIRKTGEATKTGKEKP